MKRHLVNIINILYLFFLLSCTSQSTVPIDNRYADFLEVRELKAKTIQLDTTLFRYPFQVHVWDNRAVVLDLHGTDHYFHAFSYPEFRYLSSFGKKGDAPEEMLSAENFRWSEKGLWILDANKSELTELGFTLSSDTLFRQEVVKLDKEILRALDFVIYEDSTFIIPDYTGDNRFCQVSSEGRLLRKFGVIPSANEEALANESR